MSELTQSTTHRRPWWIILFRIAFTSITVGVIFFIFFNSAQVAEVSGVKSQQVTKIINEVLDKCNVEISLTEHIVRKLAHLSEYCLLGFWLMLTVRVYTKRLFVFSSWPMLGGLIVALSDEFFQSFIPGRSSQVRDVFIDFVGVCTGVVAAAILLFCVMLLCSIVKFIFKKR
ncbi:MAG: VanZ family protein [Oscillospiraceae bacterium]